MNASNSIKRGPCFKDLTGQTFGLWQVLCQHSITNRGQTLWLCRCQCGKEKAVSGSSLRSGNRGCRSCRHLRHGKIASAEYRSWKHMLYRCNNQRCKSYPDYGGRGITVCDRWLSFEAFHHDMGDKPSPWHSINRIDNNGNYEPGNCEWSTPVEQARNCRHNRLITFRGITQCLSAWEETLGFKRGTLKTRLQTGWPTDVALTTPVRSSAHKS